MAAAPPPAPPAAAPGSSVPLRPGRGDSGRELRVLPRVHPDEEEAPYRPFGARGDGGPFPDFVHDAWDYLQAREPLPAEGEGGGGVSSSSPGLLAEPKQLEPARRRREDERRFHSWW